MTSSFPVPDESRRLPFAIVRASPKFGQIGHLALRPWHLSPRCDTLEPGEIVITAARKPGLRYGSPGEAGLSAERLQRARELAASSVEDGTHPALEVLVARRGVIALHEAFGRHGPAPEDPPMKCGDLMTTTSMSCCPHWRYHRTGCCCTPQPGARVPKRR